MHRWANVQTPLLRTSFKVYSVHVDFSPWQISSGDTEIKTLYYKDQQRWRESFPIGRAYLHQSISDEKFPWQRSSLVSRGFTSTLNTKALFGHQNLGFSPHLHHWPFVLYSPIHDVCEEAYDNSLRLLWCISY